MTFDPTKPCRTKSGLIKQTTFSPDRLYRYTLWRSWADDLFRHRNKQEFVMFIGLNPSTADETRDDPTIRRCMGFAKRWGYMEICMTNLFAFRATDPKVMKSEADPVGPDNDHWIKTVATHADMIVAAWGTHGQFKARDLEVGLLLEAMPVHALRKTKEGCPEHPLYIPYSCKPLLL